MEVLMQSPEGIVRKSLTDICTDATASDIARLIVETMRLEADDETLEFNFHITGQTGKMWVDNAFAKEVLSAIKISNFRYLNGCVVAWK